MISQNKEILILKRLFLSVKISWRDDIRNFYYFFIQIWLDGIITGWFTNTTSRTAHAKNIITIRANNAVIADAIRALEFLNIVNECWNNNRIRTKQHTSATWHKQNHNRWDDLASLLWIHRKVSWVYWTTCQRQAARLLYPGWSRTRFLKVFTLVNRHADTTEKTENVHLPCTVSLAQ